MEKILQRHDDLRYLDEATPRGKYIFLLLKLHLSRNGTIMLMFRKLLYKIQKNKEQAKELIINFPLQKIS